MTAIHRLLCTHCTFGGSELEPSTADNASKVLGYSVRRSSLSEPDRGPLRTTFRAVERLLSYDLPKDIRYSGIVTRSLKHGKFQNASQLTFDDQRGAERLKEARNRTSSFEYDEKQGI
jgi:hypothetical protein